MREWFHERWQRSTSTLTSKLLWTQTQTSAGALTQAVGRLSAWPHLRPKTWPPLLSPQTRLLPYTVVMITTSAGELSYHAHVLDIYLVFRTFYTSCFDHLQYAKMEGESLGLSHASSQQPSHVQDWSCTLCYLQRESKSQQRATPSLSTTAAE